MSFVRKSVYSGKNSEHSFTIDAFDGGVHLGSNYKDGMITDMENLMYENGTLVTRGGQEMAFQDIVGLCKGSLACDGYAIFYAGRKLYKYIPAGHPTELADIGNNSKILMFNFGGRTYILGDSKYYYCDGSQVCEVEPYVPIIMTDRSFDGSTGNVYESLNLIGRGFTVWFNFDGNNTYKLPYDDLASDDITVILNGEDISEDVSIDRASGNITVTGRSSADEGLNNLRITAYLKAENIASSRAKIQKCTIAECYGGNEGGGTRMLLSGNPDFPNHIFRSGLLDPTYFPDTDFELVGNPGDAIVAMKAQYGELIVLCRNSVHAVKYISSDGVYVFSCRTINSSIGCDMKRSVQLIDNNVVFGNSSKGIFLITSTVSENENNIVPISGNVNKTTKGILMQSKANLTDCHSIDFDGKYMLFIDGTCFVWDYRTKPYNSYAGSKKAEESLCWYIFKNMCGIYPFIVSGYLFYGHKDGGIVWYDIYAYDFGSNIASKFATSNLWLGFPRLEKKLYRMCLDYGIVDETVTNVYFRCDENMTGTYDGSFTLMDNGGSFESAYRSISELSLPKAHNYSITIDASGGKIRIKRIIMQYRI